MKDLRRMGEPLEGKDEFNKIDLKHYLHTSFGMFGGETKRVRMRFVNSLFDTVVEKFGTNDVVYQRDGEHHFTVMANVQISDQFFSWICAFRKKAQIVSPEDVSEDLKSSSKIYQADTKMYKRCSKTLNEKLKLVFI